MKKILLTLCCLLTTVLCYAYDFEVDGIYYNITSLQDLTVEVTSSPNQYYGKKVIPDTVEYANTSFKVIGIGSSAFYDNTNVSYVTMSNNIEYIGSYAFRCNYALGTIELPSSIKTIGGSAYYGCRNSRKVIYKGQLNDWLNISFSGAESNPLSVAHSLYINGQLVDEIIIPDTTKSINNYSFYGSNISKLYIGKNIEKIGYGSFGNCANLLTIYCSPTVPPTLNSSSFTTAMKGLGTLYVPTGTKELYEAATGWKDFCSIVETDNFDDLNTYYSFNVSTTAGGKVEVLGNSLSNTSLSATVKEGENVTLSFTPDNGYELKSVEVNGIDVINEVVDNGYTISSISQNTSIVVTFAELPIFLTIKSADNGSIAQQVEKGKVYSFVITPSEGWNIESVSFNGENVTSQLEDNKYTTPAITSDSELNIVYKLDESSSVKALGSQDNVSVIASNGYVIISDNDRNEKVSVYFIGGAEVATDSGNCNIQLKPGVYIVKVGDEVFKVSI